MCAILGEASDREYGVTLDFKKAFDSADWPLSLHLLQRAGTPRAVLNAVGAMWRQQQRWCTFGKCCDPSPVKNPLGLAQGDPWSPIGLAVILAGPARKLAAETDIFQATFLDGRTAFSSEVRGIRAFLQEWNCLDALGRLKTHHGKTQFYASSMTG